MEGPRWAQRPLFVSLFCCHSLVPPTAHVFRHLKMGSLRRGVLGLHRILNSTAIAPRGSVSATSPIPSETTLVPRCSILLHVSTCMKLSISSYWCLFFAGLDLIGFVAFLLIASIHQKSICPTKKAKGACLTGRFSYLSFAYPPK